MTVLGMDKRSVVPCGRNIQGGVTSPRQPSEVENQKTLKKIAELDGLRGAQARAQSRYPIDSRQQPKDRRFRRLR